MPAGRKKIFLTGLLDVATSDKENVGTLRREGPNEYVWCKGVASTVRGSAVQYDEDYTTALLTTTTGVIPNPIAFALAATVASRWGWYQVRGDDTPMSLAASCPKDVKLYTTATGGVLDNTSAASTVAITGVVADTTVTGAAISNGLTLYPKIA